LERAIGKGGSNMRKLAIVLIPLLIRALVLGAIGCGGEETKPTPTPTPTQTPTPNWRVANI